MSDHEQDDPSLSFRMTKRWYPRHPELGPPVLDTAVFTSEEQFARERKLLWPKVWLMVGRAEDIAKPGDYFIREIPANDVSLIVVRGKDNVIRAFHNVCPHRGSQLCFDKNGTGGSVRGFTCPFHGFAFDLDGTLRSVPDQGNFYDLKKDELGLRSVVTDLWAGFIFVHLDPNPRESLRSYLGEVVDGLDDYPFHEATECRPYEGLMDCNWKVLLSGFLENWHARSLHARSTTRSTARENPFAHTNFIKLLGKHRMLSFWHNPAVEPTKLGDVVYRRFGKVQAADKGKESGDAFKSMNSTYYIRNIFPNLQLGLVRGSWYVQQYWPLGIDKMLWTFRMYFPKPRNASEAFFNDYSRFTSRDNLIEDGLIAERSQFGLNAGVLKQWVFQDEEIAVHHFHKTVADYTGWPNARAAAE